MVSSSEHSTDLFVVFVDDNFHYMDGDERTLAGKFPTYEAAVERCKRIVDEYLLANHKFGMTAEELYSNYTSFGDDPFIRCVNGLPPEPPFSAWTYAKKRAHEICNKSAGKST